MIGRSLGIVRRQWRRTPSADFVPFIRVRWPSSSTRTRSVVLTFRDTLQFQLFGSSYVSAWPVTVRGKSEGYKGPSVMVPFYSTYSRLVPRTLPLAADPLISRIDTGLAFLPEITLDPVILRDYVRNAFSQTICD